MRVTLLSPVDPIAVERLRENHDVVDAVGAPQDAVAELIAGSQVVVVRSGVTLDREVLESARALKLVVRAGSGFDNIDLPTARARGVIVARIPGPASRAVAELTLGLMFAAARNIVTADASMRRAEWKKTELGGSLLKGKTAGVIGLGNIGSVTAELCQNIGMTVVGCLPDPSEITIRRFSSKGIELMSLLDIASVSDFLTVHVPLDASTHHLIDAAVLRRMRKGSYLINTSRGGVVDESALREVLERGDTLRGAALDTHESEGPGQLSPLASNERVVLTPHIGSMAIETQAEIGARVVELIAGLDSGEIEALLTEHERVA